MSAESVLDALGVHDRGKDRGLCHCTGPLHEHGDKHPSLSWRVLPDGKLLLRCFAGCSVEDILATRGLRTRDLFPDDWATNHKRHQPGRAEHSHAACDALRVLEFEAVLVAIAAEQVAAGMELDGDDRARLRQSATLIRAAAEACA